MKQLFHPRGCRCFEGKPSTHAFNDPLNVSSHTLKNAIVVLFTPSRKLTRSLDRGLFLRTFGGSAIIWADIIHLIWDLESIPILFSIRVFTP